MTDDIYTAAEFQSLINIMGFFDWRRFGEFERLGDEDLIEAKEYVLEMFRDLVTDAKRSSEDYKWTEGKHCLRFEYRNGIGLRLMYIPISEGDD